MASSTARPTLLVMIGKLSGASLVASFARLAIWAIGVATVQAATAAIVVFIAIPVGAPANSVLLATSIPMVVTLVLGLLLYLSEPLINPLGYRWNVGRIVTAVLVTTMVYAVTLRLVYTLSPAALAVVAGILLLGAIAFPSMKQPVILAARAAMILLSLTAMSVGQGGLQQKASAQYTAVARKADATRLVVRSDTGKSYQSRRTAPRET